MRYTLSVKSLIVSAVVRHDRSAQGVCAGQYVAIKSLHTMILLRSDHIMAQQTRLFDNGQREILVSIELHSASLRQALGACFILSDGTVDLLAMR